MSTTHEQMNWPKLQIADPSAASSVLLGLAPVKIGQPNETPHRGATSQAHSRVV